LFVWDAGAIAKNHLEYAEGAREARGEEATRIREPQTKKREKSSPKAGARVEETAGVCVGLVSFFLGASVA